MGLELVEEHRGISVETLEALGVYWVDEPPYTIRIPYPHRSGVWYERKALTPGYTPSKHEQKILAPSGASPHLYNPLKLGPNAGTIFICEGEYDTMSVIDCGFDAVGTQGVSTFNRTWARLYSGALVIIAFDGDSAGRKAAHDLRTIFKDLGTNVHIMEMPDDTDCNDLHKEGDLEPYIWQFLKGNGLLEVVDEAYTKEDDG